LTELLADWYKMAQTTYLQTEILLKDIVNYQNSMETFSLMLKDSEEKYSTTLSEVLSAVRDHQNEMRKRLNSSGHGSHITANNNSHNNQQQPEVTMMTNGLVKTSQHQQQLQQQQHRSANGESKQVRKALRSILVMQDEVWGILHENTKLIEQFTHLAVTSSSSSTSSLDENSQQILEDLQAAVLTNNY
jgi:dTDP-D-glucose 4,6-dehydratase